MNNYRVICDKRYCEITTIDGDDKKFLREKIEEISEALDLSLKKATVLRFIIYRATYSLTGPKARYMSTDEIIEKYKPIMDLYREKFDSFIGWLEEQPIQVIQFPEEKFLEDFQL